MSGVENSNSRKNSKSADRHTILIISIDYYLVTLKAWINKNLNEIYARDPNVIITLIIRQKK